MAKPRVFVSSTYYDLKHIRASIEAFVASLGYESILFENGDIPFQHDRALDLSCYEAVDNAHIFVLIIGGRYGSAASGQTRGAKAQDIPLEKMYDFYNSITSEEYRRARLKDIPIFVFLEKGVASEYLTYRENKDLKTIRYAHVDNVSIFKLVDEIYAQDRNNLVREFEKFEHITAWLKSQWAGLFADHLAKRKSDATLNDLALQVQGLNQVVDALKTYSETIVRKLVPDEKDSQRIIEDVDGKLAEDVAMRNPFIQYLSRYNKIEAGIELSPNVVIPLAIANSNISDFINTVNLAPAARERALRIARPASNDYNALRRSLYEINAFKSKFVTPPTWAGAHEDRSRETEHDSFIAAHLSRVRDGIELESATSPEIAEADMPRKRIATKKIGVQKDTLTPTKAVRTPALAKKTARRNLKI